jgi:serine phosphatase RsbU (regulator of sigma subunit)
VRRLARLLGISGLTAGREYPLGDLCVIGRSPNAQVRLPDLSVSRQHAKITRGVNGFIIEDQDSQLGTLVNGLRVTVSHLRHNDEITIGANAFRFVDGPDEQLSPADFSVIYNEEEAEVVSVDASDFARLQPVGVPLDPETIQRLARRLDAMLAVSRAASSSLEPVRLLNEVLRHCLEVFPAAGRALVAVPHRESQSLVVRALVLREGTDGGRFSLSRTIAAEVLNKGRSVVSNFVEGSPEGKRQSGLLPGGSLMVAPLICRGQMMGLVHVDRQTPGTPFTEDDLEVLTGMATQAALALFTAQTHESLMRQSRTEQELLAAHEVQKRFMPRGVPRVPGFAFAAHYDPSRDVGGDLYDFICLDENRVAVVVGDVSGKGFAAALVMAWVASQIRVAAHQESNPRQVLARVNENLLEARQDDLFVTIFYGVLDRRDGTVTYCNAGQVPPLVRRAGGEVELYDDDTGLPVGVVREVRFDEGRIFLDRGDTLVLVSDGVTEARDPDKQLFGMAGLRGALACSSGSPTDLVCQVLAGIREFIREQPHYDDITIVAVGASGEVEDVRATLPPGALPTGDF